MYLRFGSHGGTVGLPDGCMSLHDGCRDFHVWKRNKSLDCFTGKPLDFANMAFKPHPDNFIGLDKAAKDKAATNIDTQMNTRGSLFLPISVSSPGCMRACVQACVRACVRVCVCVCVGCVRAYVYMMRACARACLHVCVLQRLFRTDQLNTYM